MLTGFTHSVPAIVYQLHLNFKQSEQLAMTRKAWG